MATVADIRALLDGLDDEVAVQGWEQAGGSVALEAAGRYLDLDYGRFEYCTRTSTTNRPCNLIQGHKGRHQFSIM